MSKNRTQSGQVLILVLLMMIFLLTIALTINQAVIVNAKLASDTIKSAKALYAAEAYVEDALYSLKKNPDWTPVANPEEFTYTVNGEDVVKVKRSVNFGDEGIKITLQKGQTLQFQLAPGDYNRVAFQWSEELYPPLPNATAYIYPAINVHYAGYARYDLSPTPEGKVALATPGVIVQDYGQVLFSVPPDPNKEYKFYQEIRADSLPLTEATPHFDNQKNYIVRVKPFRIGTNNVVYIAPLNASDELVPNVIKGFVSITAIGEYPPDSEKSTQKAVRVSLQLPQENLYNIFDYGFFIDNDETILVK